MKWYIWLAILFLPTLLIMPQYGKWQWQNLPLLLFLLALLIGGKIYRLCKLLKLASQTKRVLQEHGFIIEKAHISPKSSYIKANRRHVSYTLNLLLRKKPYWRHHFPTPNMIEHYAVVRASYHSGRARITVNGSTYTSLKRRRRLTWPQERSAARTRMFLFDRLPVTVSDSLVGNKLGIGDKLCGKNILLYDAESFAKQLDNNATKSP